LKIDKNTENTAISDFQTKKDAQKQSKSTSFADNTNKLVKRYKKGVPGSGRLGQHI
jgi:hypothetical protein